MLAQSTVPSTGVPAGLPLVDYQAEGRQSFYFIAVPDQLDLLRSAERLPEATDRAVALCPDYGAVTSASHIKTSPAAIATSHTWRLLPAQWSPVRTARASRTA
jgi:ArsR family transcriptional regulator, cadmium/lead-responsive transcriptional repressor